jgi:SpoVK/Ycf46/Vps4 family AAA+-type ATPase
VPIDLERISEVVFFDLPAPEELKELSDTLSKKLDLKDTFRPSPEVVNNLSGLTKFEVEQAYLQSYALFKKSEGNARIDLNFIRSFKKSAIAKTDLLSLLETDVTFNDIGGMDRLKRWITRSAGGWTIEGKKYGLPIMKGVLLVGPPGTGKSLIAKSIGNEWGLPVVKFDFSKIFSSRVGDSEANLRRVLKLIEGISPVIVFIDELEKSMAGVQSSTFSDSGVTARLIGVYLSWFQDCEKPIFTVGTSNNISYVPPEMISRFEEVFFVNMPQQAERGDIVGIHLKKVGRDPDKFDLPLIAERSKDFTGREIEQIIKESLYNSFHDGKEIDTEQILSVIDKKTSVIITMQEQMRALYKWVGWDDKRMDGIRARYASVPNDLDVSKIRSEIDAIINDLEQGKA